MKKSFKRAGVAVLSMAMLLSMGAIGAMSANAAGETITVAVTGDPNTGLTSSDDVSIWQVAAQNSSGVWSWDSSVTDTTITSLSFATVEGYSSADAKKAFASKLARNLSSTSADYTGKAGSAISVTADTTAYYLVMATPTTAGQVVQPMLIQVNAGQTGTINTVKTSTIPLVKTITSVSKEGGVATGGKTAQAEDEAIVSYQIYSQLPSYDPDVESITNYVITDTPHDGIKIANTSETTLKATSSVSSGTLQGSNLKVYFSDDTTLDTNSDANVTSKVAIGTTSAGFTVTVSGSSLKSGIDLDDNGTADAIQGKYVFVTFNGMLDKDDAKLATEANVNDAVLTYGNDYATGGGSGTKNDHADVYTTAIRVIKENENSHAFAGVSFTLRKDTADGAEIETTTTNSSGHIVFMGLDAGTYYICENETAGVTDDYKIVAPIKMVIHNDSNNGTFTADDGAQTPTTIAMTAETKTFDKTIVNELKEQLPGTGGMGTVLFTVGGAAVVLLAGALFVVYMRKRKTEE